MKLKHTVQRPGLRKKYFGSKAFLTSIRKKVKRNRIPKKAMI